MVTTALPSSPGDGLELEWGAATDVGKVRRLNEDSFLVSPGAFVVADGMGGHQAGDVASKLTIEAVEGDTLRLYVSNRLPEPTTVHWHGIILPTRQLERALSRRIC